MSGLRNRDYVKSTTGYGTAMFTAFVTVAVESKFLYL